MKHPNEHYYLIHISYLGFRYHGWQKQPNVKTVQEMIERTLCYILNHNDFKILGASRTDAMVSANHSAFQLFIKEKLDTHQFFIDLNKNLPNDINALSIEAVDHSFNIIQDVEFKEYLYSFSCGEIQHPFCAPYMTYIDDELNIELMKKGAQLFIGTHNLQQFCYKPKSGTNFNREIIESEIIDINNEAAGFFPNHSFTYRIKGKGFMRHQVRLIMGTLFLLGQGDLMLDDISNSLKNGGDGILGYIAPASGLVLNKIKFYI